MIDRSVSRDFQESDIEKIHVKEGEEWRDLEAFKRCRSLSFYDGVQIVAIVGIVQVNEQTCEIFAAFDECAGNYTRKIIEYGRALLSDISEYFVRIQAIVKADWRVGCRFLEAMGFSIEGVMRKFGPNEKDYCIYARVQK
jgi:hypothetical protein